MSLDTRFNAIHDKLQLLLKELERLRKENGKLKAELEGAKDREVMKNQRIEELLQQASILKLAAGEMSDKDKKDFERKINRYIREIDQCIAYLSQ